MTVEATNKEFEVFRIGPDLGMELRLQVLPVPIINIICHERAIQIDMILNDDELRRMVAFIEKELKKR